MPVSKVGGRPVRLHRRLSLSQECGRYREGNSGFRLLYTDERPKCLHRQSTAGQQLMDSQRDPRTPRSDPGGGHSHPPTRCVHLDSIGAVYTPRTGSHPFVSLVRLPRSTVPQRQKRGIRRTRIIGWSSRYSPWCSRISTSINDTNTAAFPDTTTIQPGTAAC